MLFCDKFVYRAALKLLRPQELSAGVRLKVRIAKMVLNDLAKDRPAVPYPVWIVIEKLLRPLIGGLPHTTHRVRDLDLLWGETRGIDSGVIF